VFVLPSCVVVFVFPAKVRKMPGVSVAVIVVMGVGYNGDGSMFRSHDPFGGNTSAHDGNMDMNTHDANNMASSAASRIAPPAPFHGEYERLY